jgi:hypothetical protein
MNLAACPVPKGTFCLSLRIFFRRLQLFLSAPTRSEGIVGGNPTHFISL